MKTKKHDEREIPIDVYTKMQHMLIVESLREVMDNVSFERLIKQIGHPSFSHSLESSPVCRETPFS